MNCHAALIALAVLGPAAWSSADDRAPGSDGNSVPAALVEAHNRERVAAGRPPLTANPQLEKAAMAHARDMAGHDKMSHEGSDGSNPSQRVERAGYRFQGTGENVAEGYESIDDVMKGWMQSPHHKANILGDFTEMGGARVVSEDGKPYWCVNFGRPWPKIDLARAVPGLVEALNQARTKEGKAALKVNPKLEAAAQHHARDTAAHGEFRPKDDDGMTPLERVQKEGYSYLNYGEMAASGQPNPEDVVKAWFDTPSNREFLLGDFRDIGVGCAATDKGVPYWCLILAKPAR